MIFMLIFHNQKLTFDIISEYILTFIDIIIIQNFNVFFVSVIKVHCLGFVYRYFFVKKK